MRFTHQGKEKTGIYQDEEIVEIQGGIFSDHKELDAKYSPGEVNYLPPVTPSKIVCVGLNYADHAKEMGLPLPKEPVLFLKPPSSAVGHRDKITKPTVTDNLHYEAELAFVVGKTASNVLVEEAKDYILGHTIGNDVTARDLQQSDTQWTRAKGFDTFCPLGPWIDTDLDMGNLKIELKVNGETKQKSNTAQLTFNSHELLAYISKIMTLVPGDIIMTGTPSGVGEIIPGDEVEINIEQLGTLINKVE